MISVLDLTKLPLPFNPATDQDKQKSYKVTLVKTFPECADMVMARIIGHPVSN